MPWSPERFPWPCPAAQWKVDLFWALGDKTKIMASPCWKPGASLERMLEAQASLETGMLATSWQKGRLEASPETELCLPRG